MLLQDIEKVISCHLSLTNIYPCQIVHWGCDRNKMLRIYKSIVSKNEKALKLWLTFKFEVLWTCGEIGFYTLTAPVRVLKSMFIMKEFCLEQPRLWTQMGSTWQSIFVNEVSFNEGKSILTAHLLMKTSLVSAVRVLSWNKGQRIHLSHLRGWEKSFS